MYQTFFLNKKNVPNMIAKKNNIFERYTHDFT